MKLIGIDPGASNGGIAVFDTETKTWQLAKMPTEEDFRDWIKEYKGARVAIEKQQAWQKDRNDPKFFGIQKLILRTERMTEYMRALEMEVVEVPSVTWQSKLGKIKGESKDQRKTRYQELAGKIVGKRVSKWGGDAVMICYWLGQQQAQKKEVKQHKLF